MTRRDWAVMSTADRDAVIGGFQRAKSSGAYDELVMLHQRAMLRNANEWHRRPCLLPAHRWFLTRLEAAMGVEVPYWNWSVNRALPPGLGGNGDPAQGYRVTTGPFATWVAVVYNASTGVFTKRTPAGLIRQTATFASSLPTGAQIGTVLAQTAYDVSPWSATSTSGFRNMVEGGTGFAKPAMHNRVHEWVGGDMRAGTSPNDPLFWLHHANVDRIWASWQRRRGISTYSAPAGQGPNDPMPLTGGVTPAQMFPLPPYDNIP
jgi:tyrosinase